MRRRHCLVFALLLATAAPGGAGEPAGGHAYTNRLIDSNDPYLLLHAHNPVDWYPWGDEAFAAAERENKLIFLSVGYSTCFWCHVAERTIYSDPTIAALMNRWFINVKVDSEQRPDLDRIYMMATQLLTGRGGWPNNVFLTPDRKPFFAGSYFPPADDPARGPGFPSILTMINEVWTSEPERITGVADQVYTAMLDHQEETTGGAETAISPAAWMNQALDALLPRFDREHGGLSLGNPTKFAQAPVLDLLLAANRKGSGPEVLGRLTETLDALALGGVRDHVGGGFHRYSTEPTWSIPHFEKMLFDNAQLLRIYAEAYADTGNPLYRQVALELGAYLSREMMSPDGGFFTAEDSAIDGVEGVTYLWTEGEIANALGTTEATRFLQTYALTEMPPVPAHAGGGAAAEAHQGGVLRVRLGLAENLDQAGDLVAELDALTPLRQRLRAVRDLRPRPARDEKLIVALNGMAIRAFAVGAKVLRQSDYLRFAQRAGERIWRLAYDPRQASLHHQIFGGQAQTEGFLADYAQLGEGFLALHAVTGDEVWLRRAAALAEALLERFANDDGSLETAPRSAELLIPPLDSEDNTYPSGTSSAIALLLGLREATGEARYGEAAERVVRRLSGQLAARPANWPTAIIAARRYLKDSPVAGGEYKPPESGDFVRATANGLSTPAGDQIIVTLKIDSGYHLQANPPSLPYLVPTSVSFESVTPANIRYPDAVPFTAPFADEVLDVYDGTATIVVEFPKGTLLENAPIRGSVTAQACDDKVCLPPSELPISVP